jgi:hypothetical protein
MPLPLPALCLAVYAATAAALLWIAHRAVLRIPLGVALLLAAAPLLLTGKATLTGGVYAPLDISFHHEPLRSHREEAGIASVRTPLLSDVVYSMIPWQKAVREAVKHGRAPLWNRFVLAGEPLLAVQQPAALHPFTWIGFLLPLPQAWTFQMSARLLLALASAYLFLRDLGCRQAPALLGAFGWGLSDFLVFWLGYTVGNAVAPFPLLLLGLSRLVRDSDARAVGLTAAALVLIVLAGHPETLLFAVVGAGLYFLFLLAGAGARRRARPLALSLASGALALGLTAVVLLPLAEVLPATWEHVLRSEWYAHLPKSGTLGESLRRAEPVLLPFARGQSGHGRLDEGFGVPAGYAGAILLPLAACGLFGRDRRRFAFLGMGLFGLALWVRLPLVTDAVAALPLLDIAVLDYFVFLAVFGVCALAALGADRLLEGEGRRAFLLGAALALVAIGTLFALRRPGMLALDMPAAYLDRRLVLELAPLAAGCLLVLVGARVGARASRGTAAALVALLVAPRILEAGDVYPTLPAKAFAPHLSLLDPVPRNVPERIVGVGEMLIPNASALYELEDVRGYESMTLRPLVATFPLWCVTQGAWFNRVDDLDRPFLSFLNVRWALAPASFSPPAGWRLVRRDGATELLENERTLPRAFAPEEIRAEGDFARRVELLSGITDFAARGVVGAPAGQTTGPWAKNGLARVSIAAYRPQSMALAVEADEDAVIGTSVPAWPGWKARLDGEPIDPLSYNHAFLGFRVPPGRHRLEIAYRPDGVIAGAAVSLATLAGSLAAAVARRRRHAGVLSSPGPK